MLLSYLLGIVSLGAPAYSQLIGPVGVTTPLAQKTYECNVLKYGGVADNATDIGTAIISAFQNCVMKNSGSRLIVPAGSYYMAKSITLSNGKKWAFQLDGLITTAYLGKASSSNGFCFINIVNAVDFEFYSDNGLGGMQGQGYLYRIAGDTNRPRLVQLVSPVNTTVHDLLLIDSPKFHFVFTDALNVEIYHLTIRGANLGSYDGIDASGTNYHVHDNEITNRDECVAVESPSNHVLIENQVCNRVGSGVSIGSLLDGAQISNIHARNISVLGGNSIAFIKCFPGGSGYVTNVTWENFRSKNSAYGLNINQYWMDTLTPDTGAVTLKDISFKNFTGSIMSSDRPVLSLVGSDYSKPTNITVEDFSVWTESGSEVVNEIANVYGHGDSVYGPNNGIKALAQGATPTAYTSFYTMTAPPTGWTTPPFPKWAAPSTGYGIYTPAALWKPQGDYDKHYWGSF